MLFDKSLSSRPLSSPRHSDAPLPAENEASDAPARRPRAVSDDEKKPARPETPPPQEKTPPAPTVSPAAPPNRKRGRQWAGLDESDDDEDDDDD